MGNCLEGVNPISPPGKIKSQKLTLGYWNIRGLAAPMRLLCHYAGLEIEDKKYELVQKPGGTWVALEWMRHTKPELQHKNAFSDLPYVHNHTSGEVVAKFSAVLLYLGRLALLNGETWEEHSANEQVLFQIHDMNKDLADLVYPFKANKDEITFNKSLEQYLRDEVPVNYKKLQDWLEQRGEQHSVKDADRDAQTAARCKAMFLASESPCTCDFAAWELLDQNEALAKVFHRGSPLAQFPILLEYYYRFQELPELHRYFASENAKLPIFNKMSWFSKAPQVDSDDARLPTSN